MTTFASRGAMKLFRPISNNTAIFVVAVQNDCCVVFIKSNSCLKHLWSL